MTLYDWESHWEAPTMTRDADGTVRLVDGDDAGQVVVVVAAYPCWANHPSGRGRCGKIRGHFAKHWQCSDEIIHEGPFAVVKPMGGP